jgi:hypothetical protein
MRGFVGEGVRKIVAKTDSLAFTKVNPGFLFLKARKIYSIPVTWVDDFMGFLICSNATP